MNKLILRVLLTTALFAGVGVSMVSAQTINLSNDPIYAQSFSHYCPPYEGSFIANGIYSPTARSCVYSIPNDVRAPGHRILMALYQGIPGNSTLVHNEFVFDGSFTPTLVQIQDPGNFSGYQPGDKFFGVALSAGPQAGSRFPDIEQFNEAFTSGSTTTPNNNYHLIQWELGEFDATGPQITITNPTEGSAHAQNATVFASSTVTDNSPLKTVAYIFNDVQINPNDPLPVSLASLGPAKLTVIAIDIFDNFSESTVNFNIVPATTDICPNVPGTQTSSPCADETCVNGGGTWNGSSCILPTPTDTTAPVITITNPLKYAIYERAETVFLTATVTDTSAIATTTYWFNGKKINPANKLAFNSSTPILSKVSVAASDIYGNKSTSTLAFFVVKNKNSCLTDLVAILLAIKLDHTLPDKPTIEQLIANCKDLLKGYHR